MTAPIRVDEQDHGEPRIVPGPIPPAAATLVVDIRDGVVPRVVRTAEGGGHVATPDGGADEPDDGAGVAGESLDVDERVVVASATGIFEFEDAVSPGARGGTIRAGQVIGVVRNVGHATPVVSAFEGRFMGAFVASGERVREGAPVVWLRAGCDQADDVGADPAVTGRRRRRSHP